MNGYKGEISPESIWKKIIRAGDKLAKEQQEWRRLRAIRSSNIGPLRSDVWPVDGIDGARFYKIFFSSLMKNEVLNAEFSFENWIKERKEREESTHILEIFGGAYFINDFTNLDSITGVRLGNVDDDLRMIYAADDEDTESRNLQAIIASEKRKIIEGNFFNRYTYFKMQQRIKELDAPAYDMILLKPVGGLSGQRVIIESSINQLLSFYFLQLNRIYQLLSNHDGILLVEFPDDIWNILREKLLLLENIQGLEIQIDNDFMSLKIKKKLDAPAKLPLAL